MTITTHNGLSKPHTNASPLMYAVQEARDVEVVACGACVQPTDVVHDAIAFRAPAGVRCDRCGWTSPGVLPS